jgi:feruloyl esterase
MVYGKPDWDYRTFQIESGLKAAVVKTATALDAVDTDLRPFKQRGGKLILYHGWQDPAIPALSSVRYYDAVRQRLGESETDSFLRFYLAAGMQHCGGGPGPDGFGETGDWSSEDAGHSLRISLEEWVEKGKQPTSVVATKFTDSEKHSVQLTRPLCPYPQAAFYKGAGDPNQAGNFVCKIEKP